MLLMLLINVIMAYLGVFTFFIIKPNKTNNDLMGCYCDVVCFVGRKLTPFHRASLIQVFFQGKHIGPSPTKK